MYGMPAVTVRVPIKLIDSGARVRPFCYFTRAHIAPFFNFMDIIDNVRKAQEQGSKFGTERTAELLSRLGHPDEKLKIVHVAGSNGKGSVCRYITEILVAAGRTVGTFTSPEVYSFEDMFALNGKTARRPLVEKYLSVVDRAAEGMSDAPSAFERETCTALAMFAGEGCEYCVLECGLGGLEDATNAVSGKLVAVITSITTEHTAVLGDTIADICRHKSGIIKNCPAVVPANLNGEAARYFNALGAVVAGEGLKLVNRSLDGQKFLYKGEEYSILMPGDEQLYNAAVAIEVAKILSLPLSAVKKGLACARPEGRTEVIKKGATMYILDGAHNPQAFGPLISMLPGKADTLVYTCLSDKNVGQCAALLGRLFKRVFIVPAPSYRAMDEGQILRAFAPYCDNVRSFCDIPSAMEAASGRVIVACGSFTMLKEVRQWIDKKQ